MSVKLTVNNQSHELDIDPNMPLLWAIRDHLQLTGTKFGCGMALCGACTVHIDGQAVRSCVTPVSAVEGKRVTTIEGLGTQDRPHPLQQAFLDEQAGQCGYCLPGILISAKALLDRNLVPSRAEIAEALDDNICRCGSHVRILRAVARAARVLREGGAR